MSDFNDNIRRTFDNLLKIYQDAAMIFRDLDALLEEAGYKCLHGSGVVTESSKSLHYPEWWFYQYMLRGYASETDPFDFKAAGIFFLDNRGKLINPLLLFGGCRLTNVSKEERRGQVVFIRDAWFKSGAEKVLDQKYEVEGIPGIDGGFVQGIALEQVKDISTLRELVVSPFLALDG